MGKQRGINKNTRSGLYYNEFEMLNPIDCNFDSKFDCNVKVVEHILEVVKIKSEITEGGET